MSTNPNNAIGTNGAYGGRTSVNAFNDLANAFTRGIISGWACSPDSGLTVSLGGDGTTRDVAIAVDNAGNRTTINNISGSPVNVTLSSAPASNSRIDLIVAYVDNPPQGDSSTADNPGACGIIPVTGTASASPLPPSENTIRTAITSDGASGTTAYYVVLAQITITSGTTDITSDNIAQDTVSTLAGKTITSDSIDFTTFPGKTFTPQTFSTTKSVGSTWTTYDTYTIPSSGLYFIRLSLSGGSSGSTEFRSEARLTQNGTTIRSFGAWSINNYAGNNFTENNAVFMGWLESGDIIKTEGHNNNWTGTLAVNCSIHKIY